MNTFPDRWRAAATGKEYSYDRENMRLRGNLSYLQFIRLVEALWEEAHPDIPFRPTGSNLTAVYPSIMYALELRKPHPSEPKMRAREELKDEEGQAYIINAQRFQNIVSFTVMTETEPVLAEEILEAFEDFMIEWTPVYKELGVSEFAYGRRIADTGASRPGEGVVRRAVTYMVTTEKIILSPVDLLQSISIEVRKAFETEHYIFYGFAATDTIKVDDLELSIGEGISIISRSGTPLPGGLRSGYYIVSNIIIGQEGKSYTLSLPGGGATPNSSIVFSSDGSGKIVARDSGNNPVTIIDEFMTNYAN